MSHDCDCDNCRETDSRWAPFRESERAKKEDCPRDIHVWTFDRAFVSEGKDYSLVWNQAECEWILGERCANCGVMLPVGKPLDKPLKANDTKAVKQEIRAMELGWLPVTESVPTFEEWVALRLDPDNVENRDYQPETDAEWSTWLSWDLYRGGGQGPDEV